MGVLIGVHLLFSQDFPSSSNKKPFLQEHRTPWPFLLQIWSQPPLSFVSQGWTEQTKPYVNSREVMGNSTAHYSQKNQVVTLPMEHVFLSWFNRWPSLHLQITPLPFFLQMCWQPPFSSLSHGWTEIQQFSSRNLLSSGFSCVRASEWQTRNIPFSHVFRSSSIENPLGQSQTASPPFLLQMCEQPPFFTSHGWTEKKSHCSSFRVKCLFHLNRTG